MDKMPPEKLTELLPDTLSEARSSAENGKAHYIEVEAYIAHHNYETDVKIAAFKRTVTGVARIWVIELKLTTINDLE